MIFRRYPKLKMQQGLLEDSSGATAWGVAPGGTQRLQLMKPEVAGQSFIKFLSSLFFKFSQ